MKLTIGDYEVEIRAKRDAESKTKDFLNQVSSAMWSAYLKNEEMGYQFLADVQRQMGNDIYDALDAKGYYNSVKGVI